MRTLRSALVITLLLGAASAVAVTAGLPVQQRTFTGLLGPVQSLMSVTAPLVGIALVSPVHRYGPGWRPAPPLLTAVAVAVALGIVGSLLCAAALAVASSPATDRWGHLAASVLGALLVQVVAQLVGTGLGLLIRRRLVAFLASMVIPLGAWVALGAVDGLRPAQALTPFDHVPVLLAGEMTGARWGQWLAMVLIWCVGLNGAGLLRLRRRTTGPPLS